MLAYQKWKEKCVHHLEGDWAFVVFNPTTESIFIAKDPFGYSAIFYRKTSDQFYFSTLTDSLSSISTLTNQSNFKQLFRQSIAFVGPSITETLIENIYSVECGTYTFWDKCLTEKKFKYFSLQKLHSIRYRDDLDYSFSLSSIFSLSVKSKIRDCKSVGIFLSGGLDSTGVAHFASNELSNQGKILNSFTSFPFYLNEISEKQLAVANEVPLVQKFVQMHKNIEANFYNFPEARLSNLLLSEYTKDAYTPVVNPNSFWIEGILSEMKSKKIVVVLNGQLGNYTLTPSAPFIHSEMFISFKFISLFKDLWTISQRKYQPILQIGRAHV
jgi:asparagine synthase (glutamine-hydrolysing)